MVLSVALGHVGLPLSLVVVALGVDHDAEPVAVVVLPGAVVVVAEVVEEDAIAYSHFCVFFA